jgi:GT2 family glycosyltransferase
MIDPDRENDVLLAFCHNGTVQECFMHSVLDTFSEDAARGVRGERRRLVEYFGAPGPYIHDNRARAARYFLECTDKQWLWFCDNDMQFPAYALYELLDAAEEHDLPVVGAAYWNTYPGMETYLAWLAFVPKKGLVACPDLPTDRTQPIEVSALGMGCTIIHRQVLQDVADAHPNDPWDTFGADVLIRFEDGGLLIVPSVFDPRIDLDTLKDRPFAEEPVRLGEDVTFCLRARMMGYRCYGLPSLVVEHYKPHLVAPGSQWHGRSAAEASELVKR